MTERIWVQAAGDDRRVPVEGQRGVYFEAGKKHQVRHTPFIERRLAEKDLVKIDAPAVETAPAATPTPSAPGAASGSMGSGAATAGAATEKGA